MSRGVCPIVYETHASDSVYIFHFLNIMSVINERYHQRNEVASITCGHAGQGHQCETYCMKLSLINTRGGI